MKQDAILKQETEPKLVTCQNCGERVEEWHFLCPECGETL